MQTHRAFAYDASSQQEHYWITPFYIWPLIQASSLIATVRLMTLQTSADFTPAEKWRAIIVNMGGWFLFGGGFAFWLLFPWR